MNAGITLAMIAPVLCRVVDNGVCEDDPRVLARTNEATQELLVSTDPRNGQPIIPIGTMATYDVQAVGTQLVLPKELENAIVVEPLGTATVRGQSDVRQSWYDLVNPFTYVDPNLAHDNPLVDQFLIADPDWAGVEGGGPGGEDVPPRALRRAYDYPGLMPNSVVRVTGQKRYQPITSPAEYLIIQNVVALKLMIQAITHRENLDLEGGTKLKDEAMRVLADEVIHFLLDPRQVQKRKASYEADMDSFPAGSFGYFRAWLAFELPAGLQRGKSELSRLLEMAERQLMTKGHPVGTLEEFRACVTGGRILAPERVKSIVAADLCGLKLDIRNIFFQYLKNGPGREWATMLIDEGDHYDQATGKRYRQYRLNGVCGSSKNEITFVAKLQWMKKAPEEQMTIRNFEALRLMCVSILHQQAEKWPEAGAAKKEARELLEAEQADYLAGQQLTIPFMTANEGYGCGGQIGRML